MRRLAALASVSLLAVAAVRAGSVDVDFDPKAPFEKYKTWAWAPGRDQVQTGVLVDATVRERVEKALADTSAPRG